MTRTRTITVTLGSIAAGALLATGVTGLAMADDSGASSVPSSSVPSSHGPSSTVPGGPGRPGLPGGMALPGVTALYGEVVVQAEDGTITTVRQIRGSVTDVSAGSITVAAADGYSATFTVTSDTTVRVGLPDIGRGPDGATTGTSDDSPGTTDTIADVAVGDVARIDGTVSGSTATAAQVHALTTEDAAAMEQHRQEHMTQDRPDRATRTAVRSS